MHRAKSAVCDCLLLYDVCLIVSISATDVGPYTYCQPVSQTGVYLAQHIIWYTTNLFVCVCKGPKATSRSVTDGVGSGLVMLGRCRVFLYPVIYMSQYDVVRTALIDFVQKTLAVFTRKRPPGTN